jgi:hypothetical protein
MAKLLFWLGNIRWFYTVIQYIRKGGQRLSRPLLTLMLDLSNTEATMFEAYIFSGATIPIKFNAL